MDFPLSIQVPGKGGDTLAFKALQTYSDGKVVRWIGSESSETPAPTLEVTSARSETAGASDPPAASAPAAASGSNSSDDGDGGSGNGLAIAALIVGVLALLGAAAALARTRRPGAVT
jgi:hypothetical protein